MAVSQKSLEMRLPARKNQMVKRKYPKPIRYDHVKIPIFKCCNQEFKGKASYTAHLNSAHSNAVSSQDDVIQAEVIDDGIIKAEIVEN